MPNGHQVYSMSLSHDGRLATLMLATFSAADSA